MNVKKKNCSIRDVAAYLNLAPSTVSRVLNNRMGTLRVAPETRERILAAAAELNYTPNVHAKRLFSRRSNVLALVLPAFATRDTQVFQDHHMVGFFSGMEHALMDTDYRPLVVFNDRRFAQKKEYLALFREQAIDAMMVWGSCAEESFWQETIDGSDLILFLTNPPFGREHFQYMMHDYEAAACIVLTHLLEKGHKKIAWIGGHPEYGTNKDMEIGIRKAMSRFPDVEIYSAYGDYKVERSVQAAFGLLEAHPDVSAVLAAGAGCAEGIYAAMREKGIMVPGRMALAACDCVEYLEKSDISCAVVDDFELGRQSVRAVLDALNGKKEKIKVKIPVRFRQGVTS